MTPARIYTFIGILAAILSAPVMWYQIDRSPPLIYRGGWFEAVPVNGKTGERIMVAAPGQEVILALNIEWPRLNCSTELERRFIGSDGAIYKVSRAENEPQRLGPPPARILSADRTLVSRRRVVLPAELPDGIATHSPDVWERCAAPAEKWGDWLTEVWPIFIGPAGADIQIRIQK